MERSGEYRRAGKPASGHGHHSSADIGVQTVCECSDKELQEVECGEGQAVVGGCRVEGGHLTY